MDENKSDTKMEDVEVDAETMAAVEADAAVVAATLSPIFTILTVYLAAR